MTLTLCIVGYLIIGYCVAGKYYQKQPEVPLNGFTPKEVLKLIAEALIAGILIGWLVAHR